MMGTPVLGSVIGFCLFLSTSAYRCKEAQLNSGAYTNLCGLCVGGDTGLEDNQGLDDCGVCYGGGGCAQCNRGLLSDGCGNCFERNDPSLNNCTRLKYVTPEVADLAVLRGKVPFLLHGINLINSALGKLVCFLKSEQNPSEGREENSAVEARQTEDGALQIEVDVSSLALGVYLVDCESVSTGKIPTDAVLIIVDSRNIQLEKVSVQNVKTGMYFQATFTGDTISKEYLKTENLVCFLRNQGTGKQLLAVSAGHVRDGLIDCDEMMTTRSGDLKIGVAASVIAAERGVAPALSMEARAIPLLPLEASFSTDLRQLLVTFNHNIESESCEELFNGTTKRSFGAAVYQGNWPACSTGWDCWLRGNKFIVQLGKDAKVRPGSRLFLRQRSTHGNDAIDPRSADLSSYTVVLQDSISKIVPPHYRVVGPRMACRSTRSSSMWPSAKKDPPNSARRFSDSFTTIEVQGLAGQNLRYNWTVGLAPPSNSSRRLSQQDILSRWISIHSLKNALRVALANSTGEQIVLNNNLMLSGVEYVLTVRGENFLGEVGDERNISLKLVDPPKTPMRTSPASTANSPQSNEDTDIVEHRLVNESGPGMRSGPDRNSSVVPTSVCDSEVPPDVVLLGSAAVFVDTESWAEAVVSCCDGKVVMEVFNRVQFQWSVEETGTGEKIEIGAQHGKRLRIAPGLLRGGTSYNVECHLVDTGGNGSSNSIIGYADMNVSTLERGVRARVNVTATTIGVAHSLVLDATKTSDLDNKRGSLKFEWSCFSIEDSRYACRMPGSHKELLQEKFSSEFSKSVLVLPAGVLPIGRYTFTVTASKESSSSPLSSDRAVVQVAVIGGEPVSISIPPSQPILVNPREGFILSVMVDHLRPGCRIFWSFVRAVGYMYFDLSSVGLSEETIITAEDESQREVSLEFSRESANKSVLVDDARYLLRVTAACPGRRSDLAVESFAEIDIETDSPPQTRALQVEPKDGIGLLTMFKFSTSAAYDRMSDHPLSYSFGFRVLGGDDNDRTHEQFFHTSTQQLWAYTYLPSLLASRPTKTQSLMRVCDARRICRMVEGPILTTHPPSELTDDAIHTIATNFGSLLASQEYEDALILAETTLSTLSIAENKTLYYKASKHMENAVRAQMRKFQSRMTHSRSSLLTALRFLETARATLRHGSFSQSMLQEVVAFKDSILRLLRESSGSRRKKRHVDTSNTENEDQDEEILKPEMVKTFLDISEAAILNLNNDEQALSEKRKLLLNLAYYMDALCSSLKSSTPTFIGSKVVSFSVQKLDLRTKSSADLAVPDWRSAKSGGMPVNATASVTLGPEVAKKFPWSVVCFGGVIYPADYLSDVVTPLKPNFMRFSAVYQVRVGRPSLDAPTPTDFEGLRLKTRSLRFIIPVWNITLEKGHHLECAVWNSNSWDIKKCGFVKLVTLFNKPAVECECSILGYHTILAASDEPATSAGSTTTPTTKATSPQTTEAEQKQPIVEPTEPATSQPVTAPTPPRLSSTTEQPIDDKIKTITRLPPGIPTTNSSQNFTFKINENFNTTVGERRDVFISRLRQQILDQVEMPANMIANIDIAPGSIVVTLHLVDTDVRTVDEVVPSLAAALQSGQLNVQDVEGRELSVPAQSLQMLQWRSHHEHANLLPWIAASCTAFSLACFVAFLAAAIMVRRKQYDMQLMEDQSIQEEEKTPTYRRFHLEENLDGTEATLARVRNNTSGPYIVGTASGHAAAMATNMANASVFQPWLLKYELKPPQSPDSKEGLHSDTTGTKSGSSASRSGSSSGRGSSGSRHRRELSRHLPRSLAEDCLPILRREELQTPQDSEDRDSGIVVVGRPATSYSGGGNQHGRLSPRNSIDPASNSVTPILPGTPSDDNHNVS